MTDEDDEIQISVWKRARHRGPGNRSIGPSSMVRLSAERFTAASFDHLSYVRVQPQPPCYYPQLLAKYDNRTRIKWHSDPSLHHEFLIPAEEMRSGGHQEVWARRKFHAMHCAFTISKVPDTPHWRITSPLTAVPIASSMPSIAGWSSWMTSSHALRTRWFHVNDFGKN
ncbi:hypothetical protein E4U55_007347 [Claviceps digitariae]|nr:hypothetical protein E4U55_007347 [Claviceps digitariae]